MITYYLNDMNLSSFYEKERIKVLLTLFTPINHDSTSEFAYHCSISSKLLCPLFLLLIPLFSY